MVWQPRTGAPMKTVVAVVFAVSVCSCISVWLTIQLRGTEVPRPEEPPERLEKRSDFRWNASMVRKAYHTTRLELTGTLVVVVALGVDGVGNSYVMRQWRDVLLVSDVGPIVEQYAAEGFPVLWLHSQSKRRVWNCLHQLARQAGYDKLLLASGYAYGAPSALKVIAEALDQGDTLVVPSTNRHFDMTISSCRVSIEGLGDDAMERDVARAADVQAHLSKVHLKGARNVVKKAGRICLDDSFVGIHLDHVIRFAPDGILFDDDEMTSNPVDSLVERMLAANVEPRILRNAYVFVDPTRRDKLVDVAPLPPPDLTPLPVPGRRRKRYRAYEWKIFRDAAIKSCDFSKSSFVSRDAEKCKTKCIGMAKCRGFSFMKLTKTCYLKSCVDRGLMRGMPGVDSWIKKEVPVSDKDECRAGTSIQLTKAREKMTRRVAVLVTVHDAADFVERCLRSIWRMTTSPYHLYLVNDDSSQRTLERIRNLVEDAEEGATLVNWEPSTTRMGYTKAINLGLRRALKDGPYDAYCLLNSDTEVMADWLDVLTEAAFADEAIGIVGPLSNAASYQSVPDLHDLGTNATDWSKNALPWAWTAAEVDRAVRRGSRGLLIDVPVLNGFCMFVKHGVIAKVGLMDDVAFPSGFGEENDFCLRALRFGFRLKVVEGAYVWHHKSKSYGDQTRVALSKAARTILRLRWGKLLTDASKALESNIQLREARRRLRASISGTASESEVVSSPTSLRVLFVLNPMKKENRHKLALHGGWISVLNQAAGLRRTGVGASVAISEWTIPVFEENFPSLRSGSPPVPLLGYPDTVRTPIDLAAALYPYTGVYDMIIGTLFTTIEAIAHLAACYPFVRTGYFVQDYEANFDGLSPALREQALASYTRVDGMLLFAKTRWLKTTVERYHPGVVVQKIQPAVDLAVFRNARTLADTSAVGRDDIIRVVAMVRPQTPRRNPEATLRVLLQLKTTFGSRVSVTTFGCTADEFEESLIELSRSEPSSALALYEEGTSFIDHRGSLPRDAVASLFARSDMFLDMSFWQAFGRTGLEAMASGCVPVLPVGSGTEEYAIHGVNAMLHNSSDGGNDAFARIASLVHHSDRLASMRQRALTTAADYDLPAAADVLLATLCNHSTTSLRPHQCAVHLRRRDGAVGTVVKTTDSSSVHRRILSDDDHPPVVSDLI